MSVQDMYDTFGNTARKQGDDYTDIMSRYKKLYDSPDGGTNPRPTTLTLPTYNTSQNYDDSFKNLTELGRTGGFSENDIANLRARGTSPIRAVYGNANRNLARQKSLQGGYSPNMGAITAKMAREMGGELSDAVTNVNASIAQTQAANKLNASNSLASLAEQEQARHNSFDAENADRQNKWEEGNRTEEDMMNQYLMQSRLAALSGMTGLYGTTPAATNMMGNQALNNAQLQNLMDQQGFDNQLKTIQMTPNSAEMNRNPGGLDTRRTGRMSLADQRAFDPKIRAAAMARFGGQA